MTNRPSSITLMFRMFVTILVIVFLMSMFWNALSGINMFAFKAVVGVSIVLTFLFTGVGWIVSNLGSKLLLKNNEEYQDWKNKGGRPYWDSLGWPINTATPIERQTGLAEPEYTTFVPPSNWLYQCPACGSRVEKQIDTCWNCNYGADGDDTAYVNRWGGGNTSTPTSSTPTGCRPIS